MTFPSTSGTTGAVRAEDGPVCVALTFLFLGVAYALPFTLWSRIDPSLAIKSVGTMNLYTLTAWGGLSHFLYAFRGQWKGLSRTSSWSLGAMGFFSLMLVVLASLAMIRQMTPVRIFDGVVWFYFVPHFLRAERVFQHAAPFHRGDVVLLLMSFAWFSVVVIGYLYWSEHEVRSYTIGVALIAILLAAGGLKGLRDSRRAPILLTAAFLLGESLVWSGYACYMTPTFADGIYGFHVAAASFYHYARSYAFGMRQTEGRCGVRDRLLTLPGIFAVNLTVVTLGALLGNSATGSSQVAAKSLLGPQYFTVWVAWHLIASDLFPVFRARFTKPPVSPLVGQSQ